MPKLGLSFSSKRRDFVKFACDFNVASLKLLKSLA